MKNIKLIAEIGWNHMGSINLAERMIKAAKNGGAKFAKMDLIGLPWKLVVGPKGVAEGRVELSNRKTGESQMLSAEVACAELVKMFSQLSDRLY